MAAIQGEFGTAVRRGDSNSANSSDLNSYTEAVTQFDSYNVSNRFFAPYARWYVSRQPSRNISAEKVGSSFFYDFYNRIYVVPSALDAGNLLSSQVRHVILWNAFIETKTLEAVALGPQSGISVTPPTGVVPPHEMLPLRELDFVVRIESSGPPSIDSYVRFTVESAQYSVPIFGRRIVLFPFAPNWRSPVDETVTLRSWVLAAEDGSEQTGSESGEIARRSMEFNINLRDAAETQRFENLVFAWQSRFFGVPHWGEESRLESEVEPGDLVLSFDTFGLSIESGSLICIYRDDEENEIREVESFTESSVTLTTPIENYWPEGSRVYPCFVGLMSEEVSGSRETSRVGRVPVMFDFEPSVTPGNTAATAAPLTYRGKELYLGKTNWKSAMPVSFAADTQRVDLNTGKIRSYTSSSFSRIARRHNWNLYDRQDIFSFRQFLGRRQGVAKSVYMPSGTEDFTMAEPILENENILTVEKNEYGGLAGAHPARRDIIIELYDGTYFCRRIESTSDFGSFTRLQIDSSLGVELSPSDVSRISFLTLYRFQSPSTTIRYLSDSKATVDAMLLAKTTED